MTFGRRLPEKSHRHVTCRRTLESAMQNLQLLRPLVSVALCSALGVALLGCRQRCRKYGRHAVYRTGHAAASAERFQCQSCRGRRRRARQSASNHRPRRRSQRSAPSSVQSQASTASRSRPTRRSRRARPRITRPTKPKTLAELVALFQGEEQNGGGAQMRSFAAKTLPVLEKDLQRSAKGARLTVTVPALARRSLSERGVCRR